MKFMQSNSGKGLIMFIGLMVFAFLSPMNLSAITYVSFSAEIGIDTAGNEVAVWEVLDLLSDTSSIQASSKPFAGSWSVPVLVSVAGQDSTGPRMVMNDSGDTVAIWRGEVGSGKNNLYGAMLPLGGAWSIPQQISVLGDDVRPDYKVWLNAAGDILVVYHSYISHHLFGSTATFGGSFSPPIQVSN